VRAAQACGGAGEPVLPKGAHEQQAWTASFAPRKVLGPDISRASTFVCVSFDLSPAGKKKINQNVRAAPSVTGMEGSVKNKIPIIDRGCGTKQPSFKKKINWVALAYCHSINFIFFTVLQCLARLVPRP